jgi:hypothetical protein
MAAEDVPCHLILFHRSFLIIYPTFLSEILFVETIPNNGQANRTITYPYIFQKAFAYEPIPIIIPGLLSVLPMLKIFC